ncbi:MAG: calcium-binding protein, partial [Bacteroidota bacterium]
MADKATIVTPNDKGQFTLSVPQSSIQRVDVIDVDMVLTTKTGERLILPGAALDAMTATPPAVHFSNGNVGADNLLTSVDKVETPNTSIPAMTSLTEFDQKRTEGKKNRTADEKDKVDAAAQEAQSQQVAALSTSGSESSVDKLVAKSERMELEMRQGVFTPEPPKIHQPTIPSPPQPAPQPKTAKIPLQMSLDEANYTDTYPASPPTHAPGIVYGATGPGSSSSLPNGSNITSDILPGDALQYGTETLIGGTSGDIFYADGLYRAAGWNATGTTVLNPASTYAVLDKETGLAPSGTAFYYAKEFSLRVAGYIRNLDSITISGLPPGVSIQGATDLHNGSWSLVESDVTQHPSTLVVVYDTTTIRALFNKDSDGDGVNDYVDYEMTVHMTGLGVTPLDVTQKFVLRFQDVDNITDVTNNPPVLVKGYGGGYSNVYIMPMAGAPELIVTYNGTYDGAQSFADNAAASAATVDGNNTVYAGNSADTILAGAGDDIIYAYAGDDRISAGNGTNTVWAGDGNDTVYSGTGNDILHLGRGDNTLNDTGGDNTIDVVLTKTVKGTVVSGNGNDVITITGNGNNTIIVGNEADSFTDGDDTVTTATGSDVINVGDGNNLVTTGNGKKVITAGSGNDTITTTGGNGDDTIAAGDGNNWVTAGDGANTITAGSGNDTVTTGSGNDDIRVGAGANTVTDGGGSNFISTSANSGKDVISITAGTGADTNTIWTGTENDSVTDGDDTVTTGDSVDTIHVGDGANLVTTGNGKKVIFAGSGDDIITTTGGNGDDTIAAGDGRNW